MTNKTIDGVPREQIALFESIIGKKPDAFLHEPVYQVTESEILDFARALLAAPDPIVEADGIGEPVARFNIHTYTTGSMSWGEPCTVAKLSIKPAIDGEWSRYADIEPKLAALQSTIVQLKACIAELESK